MIDPRTPCLIGVAQRTLHPGAGDAPEPLEWMHEMAHAAAADSGGRDVLAAIDDLRVVYNLSWTYDDAPRRLAERLGLAVASRHESGLSGTSPQKFVNEAARRILAGESELSLVVGAEALATKKRAKKEERRLDWSFRPSEKRGMPFEDPFHPAEIAHQVFQAYLTFALFDVARRAHLGIPPADYLRAIGATLAPLSEIAAANPRAWLREAKSAEQLMAVTPANRWVAYPYPKDTVSILDLDMAAGLLLASEAKADALGVPREQRVYLRGFCHAKDPIYVAERPELWRSRAMEEASREALRCAGATLADVAHFDLYSCFASSLHFAQDALGLAADDPRPLSVTGGLPFHGGPGNDYMTHSIASLAEVLRRDRGALGLASGVGMHMQNHVFALYSTEPGPLVLPDEAAVQARVDAAGRRAIRQPTEACAATLATYSVVHGRAGAESALAVCDLPDGARCYARSTDPALLAALQEEEWVGRPLRLSDSGSGATRFDPA